MKTIIQVITIVLFSTIFLYSQIAEDTWEIQIDNVRSVEPALAINPINSNILVAYMEYSLSDPRILYKLFDQNGDEIANGETFNIIDIDANLFDPSIGSLSNFSFIGDYIQIKNTDDKIALSYSKPPVNGHRLFYNSYDKTKNITVYNDVDGVNNLSDIFVDDIQYTNLPKTLPLYFGYHSIESPNLVNEWKFYKWQAPLDPIDDSRIKKDNFIADETKPVNSKFERTKPLTVRNYFEGGDSSTIYFGEYEFDEDDRDSPHFENAFIYNPPDVPAQYIAVAELSHSDLFGTDWNFVKWEDGTVNRTRQENIGGNTAPEWKAMYKGQLTSDDLEGLSSNSQRKLVRTDDDIYHLVYESLGDVWYTKSLSANFQGSWSTEISLTDGYGDAKNPSLDFYGNDIVLIFEYSEGIGFEKIYCIVNQNSVWGSLEEITEIEEGYFGNAKPVVAFTPYELFVCYRNSALGGLKYSYRHLQDIFWSTESLDAYTDANSTNPTIACKKTTGSPQKVHIFYQQGNTQIKYIYCYKNSTSSGNWEITYPYLVSGGNGFLNNEYPSVSLRKNSSYWDPVVSWTGRRKEREIEQKISAKVSGWVYKYRTVVRPKSAGWGSFYVAGSNVDFTNNNSTNNTTEETVIAC